MTAIRAIHVNEVLSKADPVTAPKLTVLRCLRSYENEEINWAVDQVVRGLQHKLSDVEVADVMLPSYRILSGVTNDPDDKHFDPMDQFPAVLEMVKNAGMLIIGSCECCGMPHSNIVRLIERLNYVAEAQVKEGKSPILDRVPVAVVVAGGMGVGLATSSLVNSLLDFGMIPAGVAAWSNGKGKAFKSDDFAATLGKLANNLADLAGR